MTDRKLKYDSFMKMCSELYPDIIQKIYYPRLGERTKYIFLYLYHKAQTTGNDTVFCTRREILEYFWKDLDTDDITLNITSLVNRGYISRKVVSSEGRGVIGNEYEILVK